MGATAYGGKGFKGRSGVSGERPTGAASCRQQHNQASCQPPAPSTLRMTVGSSPTSSAPQPPILLRQHAAETALPPPVAAAIGTSLQPPPPPALRSVPAPAREGRPRATGVAAGQDPAPGGGGGVRGALRTSKWLYGSMDLWSLEAPDIRHMAGGPCRGQTMHL